LGEEHFGRAKFIFYKDFLPCFARETAAGLEEPVEKRRPISNALGNDDHYFFRNSPLNTPSSSEDSLSEKSFRSRREAAISL
jgi:hypothetical protein